MNDPKKRFSNRVENYVKYRPKYPPEVIDFLRQEINLSPSFIVADIGSGTGILSEMFLRNGNTVFCVEPNDEMRKSAEQLLEKYSNFISINGSAEDTTLESKSIDLITAGQAFHWFNVEKSKIEFSRILKPSGWVMLIWNIRKDDSSPFLKEYQNLLNNYATDYKDADHKNKGEDVFNRFFKNYKLKIFYNYQEFDYEGLKGRLLSSSYAPLEGHPNYEPMINSLKEIFEKYQIDGKVKFEYNTELYLGKIST